VGGIWSVVGVGGVVVLDVLVDGVCVCVVVSVQPALILLEFPT
jgi:hypothetical protein